MRAKVRKTLVREAIMAKGKNCRLDLMQHRKYEEYKSYYSWRKHKRLVSSARSLEQGLAFRFANVKVKVRCLNKLHIVELKEGKLILHGHPNVQAERLLMTMGGNRPPCIKILDYWRSEHGDVQTRRGRHSYRAYNLLPDALKLPYLSRVEVHHAYDLDGKNSGCSLMYQLFGDKEERSPCEMKDRALYRMNYSYWNHPPLILKKGLCRAFTKVISQSEIGKKVAKSWGAKGFAGKDLDFSHRNELPTEITFGYKPMNERGFLKLDARIPWHWYTKIYKQGLSIWKGKPVIGMRELEDKIEVVLLDIKPGDPEDEDEKGKLTFCNQSVIIRSMDELKEN